MQDADDAMASREPKFQQFGTPVKTNGALDSSIESSIQDVLNAMMLLLIQSCLVEQSQEVALQHFLLLMFT